MFIQVINLDTSIDRRKKYEGFFSNQGLNIVRLRATNGLSDVKIIELDEDKKKYKEVNIDDMKNGIFFLKKNTLYEIFDKKAPEIICHYRFEPEKMILKKKRHRRQLTIGELGCLLSHMRAIKNVANCDNDFGIIFEDDVVLVENFYSKLINVIKNAPKNFGILKLDGTSVKNLFRCNDHRSSFMFSAFQYGFNKYFYNSKSELLHGVSGATGYVITKTCAKKLVKLFNEEIINGLEGAADILLYVLLPKKYNYENIWIIKHPIVYQSGDESNITSMGRLNI